MEAVRGISEKYKVVYVTGDFNLDLARTGEAGYYKQQLLHRWTTFTEEHGLQWSQTGPTFVSDGLFRNDREHRTAILDHIYARSCHELVCHVLPDLTSDHRPVLANVKSAPIRKPRRVTKAERNWKAMDKTALQMASLEWEWSPLLGTTEVNSEAGRHGSVGSIGDSHS